MELFLIIVLIALPPVPVFHFVLHALLTTWRKHPLSFYMLSGLVWFLWEISILRKGDFVTTAFLVPSAAMAGFGLLLVFSSFVFIALSFAMLGPGRFFSYAVLRPAEARQHPVSKGVYRFFNHPAYFGYQLLTLGSFLMSGWWSLLALFVWLFLTTPIVIYLEEKEMGKRLRITHPHEQN